ncbi:MAG: penicillin-binding protein [Clostridiales bacterium]|nr:penicillin-binding protein [Clostridiales bacterium]
MANKDYDDLLESFMNNSAKAYDEDKKAREQNANSLPSSYNVPASADKKAKKAQRGREIEKEMAAEKAKKAKKSKKKSKKANKQKTPTQKFFGTIGKVLLGMIMVVGVVGIVCFSVIAIYGYSIVYGDAVFDLEEEASSQNQTSFIYGYDGDEVVELTRLYGEENRIWVDLDEMSEYMTDAFIATEDKRFESHHGVDWKRTIAVFIRQNDQGGSTITQQLIKNLTDENEATYVRKFNEILNALNLERYYTKDEIIEAYLNTIYLSNGCYGVKTAAEVYFGKEVSDLNIAECACLAAITKEPSTYDPLNEPDANRTRQLWILSEMLDNGFITQEEYDDAVAYEMVFTNSENYTGSQLDDDDDDTEVETNTISSYYIDYVITTVEEDLQKMGYTSKKAHDLVYGGGLKIYTAIDFDVQDALEDVYENYINMPDETVQGAMCVMDYSGRVMGIVGGTGKKEGALLFNRATMSNRPPGSVIKPLSVYAPALEKSLTDDDTNIYWSTILQDKPFMKVDDEWWPVNQGGSYSSSYVTLQYGLAKSLNTIAGRTLDMIGVDYSYDFLSENFNISTLDSVRDVDYAPLAIGSLTNGATVLELTAAYAAFGNGGYYYEPYCYYKIEDSKGNEIITKDAESTKQQAVSEGTSWVMNKLLQTVMTSGTGTSYKLSGIECFGKTGTTNDDKDRWFVGGTPDFIAATWYGYDTPKEVTYSLSSNPSGTIWKTVMTKIYEALDESDTDYETEFPESDTIVQRSYCTTCGKLRSGTGTYGWYDVNNLPGTCSGHGSSSSSSGSKTTKSSDSDTNESTTSSDSETTAETTQSAESETTAQNSGDTAEKVENDSGDSDGGSDGDSDDDS